MEQLVQALCEPEAGRHPVQTPPLRTVHNCSKPHRTEFSYTPICGYPMRSLQEPMPTWSSWSRPVRPEAGVHPVQTPPLELYTTVQNRTELNSLTPPSVVILMRSLQEPMPMEQLVQALCDQKQGYTQFGGLRPFGVSLSLRGVGPPLRIPALPVRPFRQLRGGAPPQIGPTTPPPSPSSSR